MTYKNFIDNIIKTRGQYGISKDEYFEKHHIIPKCLGGTDEFNNIIYLYAKEHYEAHRLLALENPNNEKLIYAWWGMTNWLNPNTQERYTVTAEEYEEAKKYYSKLKSERMKGSNCIFYGLDKHGENNPHYGYKHSEETKKILSNMRKGKTMSEETKEKISKTLKSLHRVPWNTGKELSKEHKEKVSNGLINSNKVHRIEINQYDLKGNFIRSYSSIQEAAKTLGVNHGHISNCCNGSRNQAYGYIWKFANETNKDSIHPYKRKDTKKVAQIDKNTNEVICIYESLADAAKAVNGNSANITVCCSPKYPNCRTYKGYIWKYYNDEGDDNNDPND